MKSFRVVLFSAILLLPARHLSRSGTSVAFALPQTEYSEVFMFYNCENLFDFHDDSDKDDAEFLPGGTRGWNSSKYYRKLNSIAKVILSAGTWDPPALVGLCEVENEGVIKDLLRLTALKDFDYQILYSNSPDPRGIDLCIIYRSDVASVVYTKGYIPDLPSGDTAFTSRPLLYGKMLLHNQPIHLFINHWPSRRGGVLAGMPLRIALSEKIIAVTDSIMESEEFSSAILIAGDFNCTPMDDEIVLLGEAGFKNLSLSDAVNGKGTYRYRGVWNMFDQILVSQPLFQGTNAISADDFSIHSPGILLTEDKSWPGEKPFSTFDSYNYTGGFSDHLPVRVSLTITVSPFPSSR